MKRQCAKKTSALLLALLVAFGIPMPQLFAQTAPLAETLANPSFDGSGIGVYDQVYFGTAEQDPIAWRVLETDDAENKAFMFQNEVATNWYFTAIDDWRISTLRTYLNSEFLTRITGYAGEEALQGAIVTVDGDQVTLLSKPEVVAYLGTGAGSMATDLNGLEVNYWTKTPVSVIGNGYLILVFDDGEPAENRATVESGVRPAISINLANLFHSGTGTETDPFVLSGSQAVSTVTVGSFVQFGDVLWKVVDIQDGVAKVLAEHVLESKAFYELNMSNKWEHSDLRRYLNPVANSAAQSVFAFADGESDTVLTTALPDVGTEDGFFVLSNEDYQNAAYFGRNVAANAQAGSRYWLRTPSQRMLEYIYSVDSNGLPVLEQQTNETGVRSAFWMDWDQVVYASAIQDDPGENPTVTASGNGYEAGVGEATNYKLTVLNNTIGSLSNLPIFVESGQDGYEVTSANVIINDADTSNYAIAYTIADEDEQIVGYGTADADDSFVIQTTDLYSDAESGPSDLAPGNYLVSVWLQRNNETFSNEATTPVEISMTVLDDAADETVIRTEYQPYIHMRRNESMQLAATVTPVQSLTWASLKPAIAEVTPDGYLTAKMPGTAMLTITAEDGTFEYVLVVITM